MQFKVCTWTGFLDISLNFCQMSNFKTAKIILFFFLLKIEEKLYKKNVDI